MSNTLVFSGVSKKTLAIIAITVGVLFVALIGIRYAAAVAPSDYGLHEGDTVSAAGSSDPDVYIVNDWGYKRLFLNPAIFNLYGHLGGFAAVKSITPATRDAFPTSGLFRVDGTEKVYGIESTGEDVALLHWVNTTGAQAVADDANFFKKVFVINQAEFNLYSLGSNYTSVSQVPSYARVPGQTPTPVAGAITVSLAPGNPVAATTTKTNQGLEYLRVRLSGTGTVTQLTLKRGGPGSVDDFDNLYLYEGARRLTSGKSLTSAYGDVTFTSIDSGKGISVSGTKDISIVADISATAGNVDYIEMTAMTLSSGTVSGLPVRGNNMTASGATGGGVTVAKVGSIPNPNVGQKGAQLSEFKLTSNTEAASIKRLTLLQAGTVKPADFANLKLKAGTDEWSGSIDNAGYMVFDLGSGKTIAKGGEQIFKVYGDVAGKSAEDINLYFESVTDILAIGDQYGYGMTVTNTAGAGLTSTAGDFFDVTLQGGVLTIAYNGPSAANIGTDTSDTVLLKYAITAATNIEIRQTEFTLCWANAGTATNAADTTLGWPGIEDFKVTNEDTGVTMIGPQDGSAFTTSDSGSCPSSTTGAQKQFTDVYELAAGKTYNLKVTADVKSANTEAGVVSLDSGDYISVVLDNFTDDTPSISVMKYAGTTTSVADADIVPQADISGQNMTLQSASLTLGLSSAVNDQTFVRGTKDITAVGLTFKAAQASDLKVTDIVLSGYFSEAGTDFSLGSDGTTSVADLVSTVSIYEVESGTVLSSSPSSNQLSNTTGTVTFNSLNWNIPAGATKTLGVKVNLGGNTLANTDYFAFDINATSDVTALDSSSKTVNAGNADPNGAGTSTIVVTDVNTGSMAVAVAPNTPSDHAVYWGQTGDVAGKWRFTSTYEGQFIETAQFGEDDISGTQETDLATNAKAVYLTYKNKAGTELTATGAFGTVGTVSFGFAGDNRPYVPKDSSLDVTLKIDYKTKTEGATSGKTWDLAFIGDSGTGTNTFKSVGEGSGVVLQGNSTGIENQDQAAAAGTDIMNYRVFPEFAIIAPASTKLNTVDPVLKFTVTARGLSDSSLLFNGNLSAASGSIVFEVVASGVGTNDVNFTIRDAADNSTVDTGTITSATLTSPHASATFDFTTKDIEIEGGQSKTFAITLDSVAYFNTPINTSYGVGADYFQLVLYDNEASLINWVDNSTGSANDADTASTAGFLKLLPMSGYQFSAQ